MSATMKSRSGRVDGRQSPRDCWISSVPQQYYHFVRWPTGCKVSEEMPLTPSRIVAAFVLCLPLLFGCKHENHQPVDAGCDASLRGDCWCPGRGPAACSDGFHLDLVSCLCTRDSSNASVEKETAGQCLGQDEASCSTNGACHPLLGLSFQAFCAGGTIAQFEACLSGGPDGGAAETWAKHVSSGRIARFQTTELPPGWSVVSQPACASGDGPEAETTDASGDLSCRTVVNMGCFKGTPCASERVDAICVAGQWQCPPGSGGTDHCPPDASPETGG